MRKLQTSWKLLSIGAGALLIGSVAFLSLQSFFLPQYSEYCCLYDKFVPVDTGTVHRNIATSNTEIPEGARLRLSRQEFFHQRPSKEEVDANFSFDPDEALRQSIDKVDKTMQPLWNCSLPVENDLRNLFKLHYIQIPATGDTMIRTLLRAYAQRCRAGLVVVSHCIDLGLEFMLPSHQWVNGKGSARAGDICTLSYSVNRSNGVLVDLEEFRLWNQSRLTSEYVQKHADILAGHVSLGVDRYWYREPLASDEISHKLHRVRVRPVVFLRNPTHKFIHDVIVSTATSNRTSPNPLDTVTSICLMLRGMFRRTQNRTNNSTRYIERYASYLITPAQKSWVENEGIEWTSRHRTNLAMRNIIDHQVVVGITELWTESLQLLSHLIDNGSEVTDLFTFASTGTSGFVPMEKPLHNSAVAPNVWELTNGVINELYKNEVYNGTRRIMLEYLRYDIEIYEFGRFVHHHQHHRLLRERRGRRITTMDPKSRHESGNFVHLR
jgi:hypothetical protein